MDNPIISPDDPCKCGHSRSDHNEFVSCGCAHLTCFCRKFELLDVKIELLEGEDSESERGEN